MQNSLNSTIINIKNDDYQEGNIFLDISSCSSIFDSVSLNASGFYPFAFTLPSHSLLSTLSYGFSTACPTTFGC